MNVIFYRNFIKRKNSTKRPSGDGIVMDCRLKQDCSLTTPVLLIDGIDLDYNYCYFNSRYYFISDITLTTNNLYEITCTIDVLATYKPYIGDYTAYVERASSRYNSMIRDEAISQEQQITSTSFRRFEVADMQPGFSGGTFIIPVFNHVGGVTLYALDNIANASTFCNGVLMSYQSELLDLTLAELVSTIGMNVFDIAEYIGNVMWVPFSVADIAEPDTLYDDPDTIDPMIHFGPFDVGKAGHVFYRIPKTKPYLFDEIRIGGQLTNLYDDFRKYDPNYSKYKLYLPGVGDVDVNSLDGGRDDLTLRVYIDLYNGSINYSLIALEGQERRRHEIATFAGNIGINIPLTTAQNGNAGGFLQGAVGAISGIVTENYAAAASSAITAISAATETQPQIHASTGNVAVAALLPYVYFSLTNVGSGDIPQSVYGRPLMLNVQIASLTGYVKCGNAAVEIPGLEAEKDEVNSFLNGGFYYE